LPPPDVVGGGWFLDGELIVGRTSCVLAGAHDQRSQMGYNALMPPDRLFVQRRRAQIPVDAVKVADAMRIQPHRAMTCAPRLLKCGKP
jgi:hypothetical protein